MPLLPDKSMEIPLWDGSGSRPHSSISPVDKRGSTKEENQEPKSKNKRSKSWIQATMEWMKSINPIKLKTEEDPEETETKEVSSSDESSSSSDLPSDKQSVVDAIEELIDPVVKNRLFKNLIISKRRRKNEFSKTKEKDSSVKTTLRAIGSRTSAVTSENRTLVMHSKKIGGTPMRMNLYEAFGITAKHSFKVASHPLLIIEITNNGLKERYLVPRKYSLESKWLWTGRRIYLFLGHAFKEHRSHPKIFLCMLCISKNFRMAEDYYQCVDCQYACQYLRQTSVPDYCPISRIMTQEMNFPYDGVEDAKLSPTY